LYRYTTAINANQIGIATSFIVGGVMAQSEMGMNEYFSLITFLALATSIGALIQFQARGGAASLPFALIAPPCFMQSQSNHLQKITR
jgi:hypothetical protein